MADDGTVKVDEAAETSQEPAQPSQQTYEPPKGYRLVSDDDHAQSQRWREQALGGQDYFNKGKAAGFEKPEDFAGAGSVMKALDERGLTPEAFTTFFGGPGNRVDDHSGDGKVDLDSIKAELMEELETKFKHNSAMGEADTAYQNEAKMIGDYIKTLDGENKFQTDMVRNTLTVRFNSNRKMYPEDHPLHGEFAQPIGADQAKEIIDGFQQARAESIGAALHKRGDAKTKSPQPTAGPSGGQGAAENNSEPKTELEQKREAATENLRKRQAERDRKPVSSMGA